MGEFISSTFLVPKSEDFFRKVLNLKKLNENMPYIHFKMEITKSTLTLVTPNSYMEMVDIKDAYYSVPILPGHQKYLKFYFRGKHLSIYMPSKRSLLRSTQIYKITKISFF